MPEVEELQAKEEGGEEGAVEADGVSAALAKELADVDWRLQRSKKKLAAPKTAEKVASKPRKSISKLKKQRASIQNVAYVPKAKRTHSYPGM